MATGSGAIRGGTGRERGADGRADRGRFPSPGPRPAAGRRGRARVGGEAAAPGGGPDAGHAVHRLPGATRPRIEALDAPPRPRRLRRAGRPVVAGQPRPHPQPGRPVRHRGRRQRRLRQQAGRSDGPGRPARLQGRHERLPRSQRLPPGLGRVGHSRYRVDSEGTLMTQRAFALSGSLAGKTFGGNVRRSGTGETNAETTLNAAVAGTLTTRTSNTDGTITLPAGHGLVTGTFDVYFTNGIRRGVTGTVTTNSMAITLGTGDNLPAANASVNVSAPVVLDFDTTAATIVLAAVAQQRRANVTFQTVAPAAIFSLDLGRVDETAAEPWLWASGGNVANPFTSDVAQVSVSNGSSVGTNVVTIGVLRT